jgi:hypothetical protein
VTHPDDLYQLFSFGIVEQLDIPLHDRFGDFLGKDQVEHLGHEPGRFLALIRLIREIHHRS